MKIYLFLLLLIAFSNVSNSQIITTIIGNGTPIVSGDGGLATLATVQTPGGGAFDRFGKYYFADQDGQRIRKISSNGIVSTITGNGSGGFSGDGGLAIDAQLSQPQSVKIDTFGNIYISDAGNNRIRKIDITTGIINTVAGNGLGASTGDGGSASLASIWNPQDIAIDRKGNLYIAEWFSHKVRKVNSDGIITTYAGTGTLGFSGDNSGATLAEVAYPSGLAVDDTGNLYIADPSSLVSRIRKIDTFGIIRTIAGDGGSSYILDGVTATSASIVPLKIELDRLNNIFVSDRYNHRVYKITSATSIINSVAGNGSAGDSGDGGLASISSIYAPTGVSIDDCGNVYIPTVGNTSVPGSGRRIRKVTFNPPTTPTITLAGITSATVGATVTVSATVSGAGSSYSIRWYRNSVLFSTTTTPTASFVKGAGIDTITARIVPTIVYCYDSTTAEPHLVLEAPVGVGYMPERQQYSVYPNPTQQLLSISSPGAIHTITISSPVGQQWLAYTGNGSTDVRLSVAHLPAGVYIVRVNNSYSTKMVKE